MTPDALILRLPPMAAARSTCKDRHDQGTLSRERLPRREPLGSMSLEPPTWRENTRARLLPQEPFDLGRLSRDGAP